MLKEVRHYRRTQRRSAMSERELWIEYERRKRALANTARSCDEYERGIQAICRELGI